MSIQSNVNQMLGMGTLLATQHPVMRELAAKRQNVRTLETKAETIEKALKVPSNLNDKEPLGEELTEVRKQLFEADPSEKRYEEYARTKPGYIPPERRNLAQPTEEITEVSALEDPEGFLESKEEAVMEKLENQYQEHLFNTEVEKRLKQMVGPQEEMKQQECQQQQPMMISNEINQIHYIPINEELNEMQENDYSNQIQNNQQIQ